MPCVKSEVWTPTCERSRWRSFTVKPSAGETSMWGLMAHARQCHAIHQHSAYAMLLLHSPPDIPTSLGCPSFTPGHEFSCTTQQQGTEPSRIVQSTDLLPHQTSQRGRRLAQAPVKNGVGREHRRDPRPCPLARWVLAGLSTDCEPSQRDCEPSQTSATQLHAA
jgi:hypothetical protein